MAPGGDSSFSKFNVTPDFIYISPVPLLIFLATKTSSPKSLAKSIWRPPLNSSSCTEKVPRKISPVVLWLAAKDTAVSSA